MAYTKVTTDEVKPMLKTAKDLKTQVDTLKKAKGDKKRLAALEKQYAAAVKAVTTKAAADMKIATSGLKQCEKAVEEHLGRAGKRMVDSRAALAKYKKSRNNADLRPCADIEDDIRELADAADNEMDDLARSWNEYRTLDLGLDSKDQKDFISARKAVMDRTAILRTKVNKLVAMASEAEALQTAVTEATQGFETSTENRLRHAQELKKSVESTLVTLKKKNDPSRLVAVLKRWEEWRDIDDFAEFAGVIEDRRRAYKEAVATAQAANTALSTLKRSIATKKSVFTPEDLEDRKIAAVLGEVDEQFATFEAEVREGLDSIKTIAQILKDGEARVKRGR